MEGEGYGTGRQIWGSKLACHRGRAAGAAGRAIFSQPQNTKTNNNEKKPPFYSQSGYSSTKTHDLLTPSLSRQERLQLRLNVHSVPWNRIQADLSQKRSAGAPCHRDVTPYGCKLRSSLHSPTHTPHSISNLQIIMGSMEKARGDGKIQRVVSGKQGQNRYCRVPIPSPGDLTPIPHPFIAVVRMARIDPLMLTASTPHAL